MIRGFYTALSGIVESMTRQSIVSDNVANASTVGFKETLAGAAQLGFNVGASTGGPSGFIGTGTYASGARLDLAQGALQETGIATALAIQGDGLFAVMTNTGAVAYTRAGDFKADAAGHLVTEEGYKVLDVTGKPVNITAGTGNFNVLADGTVAETGQKIAVLGIPAAGLGRLGANLYEPKGPVALITPDVRQATLEASNTDMGGAMTELISLQRSFQLASRALTLQDQSLGDANALGRLK